MGCLDYHFEARRRARCPAERRHRHLSLLYDDRCKAYELQKMAATRWHLQMLLDLKRYADWRSSQNAFFRVSGKPGAGKSVLISVVIESLSKTETNGVIRSLLTQLLRKSKDAWLPLFGDLVDRKSNGPPPPPSTHDRPVLVIYALDECKDYVKLTELLARLHNEGSCRVFCTSRPLLDAPKTFSDLPTLDLHVMRAKTLCDMKLHIEKEVAKYDKLASRLSAP
ncbi:hypothetical protein BU15DRAFT_64662 [Melanogaster broomeanus]|nr:hypothetical protein BU15DRAFT_64662 [Melanogaster broomeanus]